MREFDAESIDKEYRYEMPDDTTADQHRRYMAIVRMMPSTDPKVKKFIDAMLQDNQEETR